MSEQATKRRSVLRGSVRILTGLGLTVAGAVFFLNLGVTQVEPITREVPAFDVDTSHSVRQVSVCQGAFQVLGTNPSQPDLSTPVGGATLTTNADAETIDNVDGATVFIADGEEGWAGAQTQRLDSEVATGLAAQACGAPRNESWIAAGSTVRGTSGTIVLTNPGEVPATVRVTVHDENGELTDASTTGVLVQPASQRTLSLNGFGAGRVSPVIHVQSNGSPVVASLFVSELRDIVPTGISVTNAQEAPNDTLVFPGVVNFVDHSHHDHEDDAPDEFPAVVRLLLPEAVSRVDSAQATVYAVMQDGSRPVIAEAILRAGTVTDVQIDRLPEDALAVLVTAEAPVVGGLFSSVHNNNDHDFTWMTPSTVFEADDAVDVAVAARAGVTAVNLGADDAVFQITEGDEANGQDAASEVVTVPAGAAARLRATGVVRISASEPFALGVTSSDQREIATYPVLGAPLSLGELRVYTR